MSCISCSFYGELFYKAAAWKRAGAVISGIDCVSDRALLYCIPGEMLQVIMAYGLLVAAA